MHHPAIGELIQSFGRGDAFQSIVRGVETDAAQSLSGLTITAKALYAVLLWKLTGKPALLVTDGAAEAEALYEAIGTFFSILVVDSGVPVPQMLPALDVLPNQGLSPHGQISQQRAIALYRLAAKRSSITVAPIASAMTRLYPATFYRQLPLQLKVGEDLAQEDLEEHLRRTGYEQRDPVEMVGEFSIRGGIVDIFPVDMELPVRLEMFGDTIESIRRFDPETQRSVLKLQNAEVLPMAEHLLPANTVAGWEFTKALRDPRPANLFDLAKDHLLLLSEPSQVRSAMERFWKRLQEPARTQTVEPEAIYLQEAELEAAWAPMRRVELRQLELLGEAGNLHSVDLTTQSTTAYHGNLAAAIGEYRALTERGYQVVYFGPTVGDAERLADMLQEYSVPFQLALPPDDVVSPYLKERSRLFGSSSSTMLTRAMLRRGTLFPDKKLALIGGEDLFDTSDLVAAQAQTKRVAAAFATDVADLKPGDFIVHVTHGVGKFVGVKEIVQADRKEEFLLLEYAGESKLYVPMARLDLVQKYRGAGEGKAPAMDRLGGVTWTKTKSKVKAKMRDMADELLKLYAKRQMAEGFAFSPDSNWQREFEDAFEYSATKDQLHTVRDIKRDMERPIPMDRLLCGDVGFGKTEVAMRTAFKALGDGKQVAVLTPTTVLCFQHFETFKKRFQSFPVRIEMLSRFRSAAETKQVLVDLAAGKVDIVIGTHRVLSQDVEFADLGLLIVDEEQRFGVRHKERLKQMRQNIDVLAMSATPIPRTLHMSLLGLRDMSVIETPPKDRLAVQTVVAKFDGDLIRNAIETEMNRGGQVYFIHNRVESIFERAFWVQNLLPNLRVGVGHGQMGEADLEKVLLGFMRHEFDVFVCTTIVENGLDIPLANTIIIENAQNYGLSELYQLRGRVGRSNRRAYAYLVVPENKELTEVARKRLAALKEFSDLGAGFKIAALDLELRGSGNLLGAQQSGQIEAVGYDTYLKLLDDTVRELKGEDVAPEVHASINLGIDIRIPATYIAEETQRLRAYKRVAGIESAADRTQVLEEFADRYGPVPDLVKTLATFSLLRATAQKLGIESIDRKQGYCNIKFHQSALVRPERLFELVTKTRGAQFTPAGILRLPAENPDPGDLLQTLERL